MAIFVHLNRAHNANYEPCDHEIGTNVEMQSRFGGDFLATAITWVEGYTERTQERGIYARQALIALENNACHRVSFVTER